MNIDNLMQGITDQNLAKARIIKLEQENMELHLKVKELEANQYKSGEFVPIKFAETALRAQEEHYITSIYELEKHITELNSRLAKLSNE